MSDSSDKGSEGPISRSGATQDDPMEGVCKESSSDKGEREAPDTTSKPDGKALKTSSAATSMSTKANLGGLGS